MRVEHTAAMDMHRALREMRLDDLVKTDDAADPFSEFASPLELDRLQALREGLR